MKIIKLNKNYCAEQVEIYIFTCFYRCAHHGKQFGGESQLIEEYKNRMAVLDDDMTKTHNNDGIDNETLKYSAGHFEQTAMPDENGKC